MSKDTSASARSSERPRCGRCGAFAPVRVAWPSRADLADLEAGVCEAVYTAARGAAPASVSRVRFADMALIVALVMDALARPGGPLPPVSLGKKPASVDGAGGEGGEGR